VNKAKVEPKTVQSILRHSRTQTTLDIYTQSDGDETRAAQGAFLEELGDRFGGDPVRGRVVGRIVGWALPVISP
jgi:hypothetical protein